MDKEQVCKICSSLPEHYFLTIGLNRGKEQLEELVQFEGFDNEGNPQFYLGNIPLNLKELGGYNSIIYLDTTL
jgi:hypothetical protein